MGGAPGTGGTGLRRSWFRVSVAGGAGWKGLVTEGPVAGAPAKKRNDRQRKQVTSACLPRSCVLGYSPREEKHACSMRLLLWKD